MNAAAPSGAPRRLRDLPGPRGLPLLGNALQIQRHQMHRQLEAWCDEFGPAYQLRLGGQRMLVVGDHEAVAATLRERPDNFQRTDRMRQIGLEMGLPPGVFGANGDEWQRQRRMVMAGFDPAHVRRYHPALLRVARGLAQRWTVAARAGAEIDLQADLMRYTVDAIAGLAFGAEVNTLHSDGDVIQRHLDKIFPALFQRMMSPLPLWRWFKTAQVRELEAAMAEVLRAVQGFIAQARERLAADPALRAAPQNLLEAMLVAAEQPDSGIDDTRVAGNVLTMLLAGEDTTANTLAWMIDLLWRHPEALARAAAEVRAVCGTPGPSGAWAPSMEQLAQLDYVEACAHETMRLKPVAPIIGLQAAKDCVLGGVHGGVQVPAGTVVIDLMRRIATREDRLQQAALFEPARWLEGGGNAAAKASSAKRVSMPFGAGPRICPGRYLALLEIKLAMATLLAHFDIADVHGPQTAQGETEERLSFTMMPVGLRMRLALRGDPATTA